MWVSLPVITGAASCWGLDWNGLRLNKQINKQTVCEKRTNEKQSLDLGWAQNHKAKFGSNKVLIIMTLFSHYKIRKICIGIHLYWHNNGFSFLDHNLYSLWCIDSMWVSYIVHSHFILCAVRPISCYPDNHNFFRFCFATSIIIGCKYAANCR